jgi:tetratricopeptide (TPR) repeat protein
MSPRTRIFVIAGAAAVVAAGATVALAVITSSDEGGQTRSATPLAGAPPLVLDLGVRADPEARALRRAEGYLPKRRAAATRIFRRYRSSEAQVGAAIAAWPDSSLATLERLGQERPRNSLVLLHLGYAYLWSGKSEDASAAWQRAKEAQPDSPSAQRANDALHPDFPTGQPLFVPSFQAPKGLDGLQPPAQLAFLARAARRDDPRAKLLYGLALQRLGHRLSARRQYDAAARLAPRSADAQVAAAVGRFDKARPAAAFSRLGPLTRRFPHAATVRFHLGLLLLWMARNQPGSVEEGKRQLRLARAEDPGSRPAREAKRLLDGLENVRAR